MLRAEAAPASGELVDLLVHPSADLRAEASLTLKLIGGRALPWLVTGLRFTDERRAACISMLVKWNDPTRPAEKTLWRMVTDPKETPETRSAAARVLNEIGSPRPTELGVLIALEKSRRGTEEILAARAADTPPPADLDPADREWGPRIIDQFIHPSVEVRAAARESLKAIGASSLPWVVAGLRCDDERRAACIDYLIGLKQAARPAEKSLIEMYEDSAQAPETRVAAAIVIVSLWSHGEEGIQPIIARMKDGKEDSTIRQTLALALAQSTFLPLAARQDLLDAFVDMTKGYSRRAGLAALAISAADGWWDVRREAFKRLKESCGGGMRRAATEVMTAREPGMAAALVSQAATWTDHDEQRALEAWAGAMAQAAARADVLQRAGVDEGAIRGWIFPYSGEFYGRGGKPLVMDRWAWSLLPYLTRGPGSPPIPVGIGSRLLGQARTHDFSADRFAEAMKVERALQILQAQERANHLFEALRSSLSQWSSGAIAKSIASAASRAVAMPNALIESLAADVRLNQEQLTDSRASNRRQALERLRLLGALAAPARDQIFNALRDEDLSVREAAARAIATSWAERAIQQGASIERSLADLSDGDAQTRIKAAADLQANQALITPPGHPQLILADARFLAALKDAAGRNDAFVREPMVDTLTRAWRQQRDALAMLKTRSVNPNESTLGRLTARAALKCIEAGSAAPEVVAAERKAVVDDLIRQTGGESNSALTAIRLLGRFGADMRQAIAPLEKSARGPNRELRYEASFALAHMGESGARSLAGLLASDQPEMRGLAISQLSWMGADGVAALNDVERVASNDADPGIRQMAAEAAWRIRIEADLARGQRPKLLKLLSDPRSDVRTRATARLAPLAANDLQVALAIFMLSQDENNNSVRRAASDALYPDPSHAGAMPPLPPAPLNPPSSMPETCQRLVLWLGYLSAPTPAARIEAAMRLRQSGALEPRIAEVLEKAARDGDFVTREGLTIAIGRAWRRGISIPEALYDIAAEPQTPQRIYARAALRAIGATPQ